MSEIIYTDDYRQNLKLYWRQFFPEWTIPNGFHVHHIIPKSAGGNNHPKNLIALHPDDHISIHKMRGDYWTEGMYYMKNTQFQKGNVPWNKGKPGIQEAWNKGISPSKEQVEKQRESLKEWHKNNPNALSGEKNGMFGKTHSKEWKDNRSRQQIEYAKSLSPEERKKKWSTASGKKWYVFEDGVVIYSKDKSEDKFKSGLKFKNGRKW